MNDHFREEVATRNNKTGENMLFALATAVMVIAGLYSLFMINLLLSVITVQGFSGQMILELILILLMLAAAILLFLYRDRIKTEYEYTFTNGTMDFAQVFNNKKRKTLGTMNIRNVEACGKVTSGSFRRYLDMPGIVRLNWFVNKDADLFYFHFIKDGKKSLLVIEPSEEMQDLIKKYCGSGKYQIN